MLLLQQMIVLFILMIIGYGLRKKEIIDDKVSRSLSWLVVNIANPAMILSGSVNSEKMISGSELWRTCKISIILYLGLIIAALLVPIILHVPKHSAGVYQVMTIFSNIGFMGFPLIRSMYGNDALLYASIFLIPFNLLIYTFGIAAMTTGETEQQKRKFQWGKIINIGVISSVLTILIAAFQIQTPDFVKSTVSNLSGLTAPVSMMVIGASMVHIDIKKLFTDVRLLLFSIIKLLVVPIVGMMLTKLFIQDEMMLGICLIMLATPVASMSAMLAQQYDGDYELASKGVALTTILSVITMPIVSMLVM